jgi:hypothetical protein
MLRACAAVSGKGHSFTWQQSGGLGGSATATIRSAEWILVNYSHRYSIGEFRRVAIYAASSPMHRAGPRLASGSV